MAESEIVEELECYGCGKRVGWPKENLDEWTEEDSDALAISETELCCDCLDSGKYTSLVDDCVCRESNGGRCGGCYAWKELGDERPHCYERWVGSFECTICCREVDETTKTTQRFFYGPEGNRVQICSKCHERLSKLDGFGDLLRIQIERKPREADCNG